MIKKKPYRKLKFEINDNYSVCTTSDYIIYWLFWFIPIYVICKDKTYHIQCEDLKDSEVSEDVYKWMK